KANAETSPLVRALDQSRQVGDHERAAEFATFATRAAIRADHAQIRLERGEWIVGDLGSRRGDHGNQRGLAGVGEADQADVGDEFQSEPQVTLFAGLAFLVFARCLVPGLGEVLVAATTAAPMRDPHALAGGSEIGHRFAGVIIEDQRANRNRQNHFLAGVPGAIGAFAMAAAVGFELAVVAVAEQGVVVGIGFEIDAAAVTTVATRGSATRHKLLATKRNATVAAVAGLHEYLGFVNKHLKDFSRTLARFAAGRRPAVGSENLTAHATEGVRCAGCSDDRRRPARNTKAARPRPNRLKGT